MHNDIYNDIDISLYTILRQPTTMTDLEGMAGFLSSFLSG